MSNAQTFRDAIVQEVDQLVPFAHQVPGEVRDGVQRMVDLIDGHLKAEHQLSVYPPAPAPAEPPRLPPVGAPTLHVRPGEWTDRAGVVRKAQYPLTEAARAAQPGDVIGVSGRQPK